MLLRLRRSYSELGMFNAANQWRGAVLGISTVLTRPLLPVLASLQGRGTRAGRVLLFMIGVTGICTVPIVVVLLAFADPIMALYGSGFSHRGGLLALTAITALLVALQTPMGDAIVAAGRIWSAALMNTALAAAHLAAAYWLLSRGWGAEGLALAGLLAYLAHGLWTSVFTYRISSQGQWAAPTDAARGLVDVD